MAHGRLTHPAPHVLAVLALLAVFTVHLAACARASHAPPASTPASSGVTAGLQLEGLGGARFAAAAPQARAARLAPPRDATARDAAPRGAPLAPGPSLGRVREAEQARKIVRNAQLTLEVRNDKHVERVLAAARELPARLGGYVASERRGGLVLKVRTERLNEALAQLGTLGRVTRRSVNADDVTAQYLDLEIRIDNARRLQARLGELLKQTGDVKAILEIEKEQARVTERLERLEGQLRLLRNQTTYATIDLTVREEVRPGPLGWIFKGIYLGVKWLFVWD